MNATRFFKPQQININKTQPINPPVEIPVVKPSIKQVTSFNRKRILSQQVSTMQNFKELINTDHRGGVI